MVSRSLLKTDRHLRGVVYVADSGIHGHGLFAARGFAAGDYIGTFHGAPAKRDGIHVLWVYTSSEDAAPIGRRGRNMLRFLNHAAAPNAEFEGFDLYAFGTIDRDDEITIDYGGEP